jgi:peptide/nickel transport system substrate-binding protein
VTSPKLILLKTESGETDLQSRGLNFNNYTVLKRAERGSGYSTRLWRTAKGARWALYPNLNVSDPTWRRLFRDARFRRALSLAVNRHEINQVLYYGLALEANNTVLPESPLHRPEYGKKWAGFDLARADRLLDDMGFTRRSSRGTRLLSDGRPMRITVAFTTEESEPADLLQLIRDSWAKIGVELFSKPMQRQVMRNRIFSGLVQMAMWFGLENGIPMPETTPKALAPTSQQQLQWPKWGQHFETGGKAGERVDLAPAKRLLEHNDAWRRAGSADAQARIWHQMLALHADQVFTIGLVARVPQVVVVSRRLMNVPEKGIYNWDPGAHFGIHRPDLFWFKAPGGGRP